MYSAIYIYYELYLLCIMNYRCACGGCAALCVDDCICCLYDLCILFVRSVYRLRDLYIACVIFIYAMICIGYARAHDVGAAHSE